jgi:hypothetical protein
MFGDATGDTAALLPFLQGADAKSKMLRKTCLIHVEFLADFLDIDFFWNMHTVVRFDGLSFGKRQGLSRTLN